MVFFVFEFVQQFNVRIGPDLGKGTFQNVAKGVVAPELIGMDTAVPGDTSDPPSGVVAFVELQQFQNLCGSLGILLEQAQINQGTVSMVVNGQDFLGMAGLEKIPGQVHDLMHGGPGLFVILILFDHG